MLKRHLGRRGFDVRVVHSGEAALALLNRQKPCCAILDEMMPGISGLDVVRQVRSSPKINDLAIFFYSGSFDPEKQKDAAAMGVKQWWVKGVAALPEVLDHVAEYCGG